MGQAHRPRVSKLPEGGYSPLVLSRVQGLAQPAGGLLNLGVERSGLLSRSESVPHLGFVAVGAFASAQRCRDIHPRGGFKVRRQLYPGAR